MSGWEPSKHIGWDTNMSPQFIQLPLPLSKHTHQRRRVSQDLSAQMTCNEPDSISCTLNKWCLSSDGGLGSQEWKCQVNTWICFMHISAVWWSPQISEQIQNNSLTQHTVTTTAVVTGSVHTEGMGYNWEESISVKREMNFILRQKQNKEHSNIIKHSREKDSASVWTNMVSVFYNLDDFIWGQLQIFLQISEKGKA